MSPGEIIDALGGTSEVARLCEVRPPSVSDWRHVGIPKARLMFLRLAKPEVFSALETPKPSATNRRTTDPVPGAGRGGRQPAAPHNIMDTVPDHAVILPTSSTGENT